MGGTGKYVNAKGYATVKTFPTTSGECAEFTMYLTSVYRFNSGYILTKIVGVCYTEKLGIFYMQSNI